MRLAYFFAILLISPGASVAQPPPVFRDYKNGLDVRFDGRAVDFSPDEKNALATHFHRVPKDFPEHGSCSSIVGHADVSEGDEMIQFSLSKARAEAVANALVRPPAATQIPPPSVTSNSSTLNEV
ncbi:hypothetical protein J7E70_07140 [Variovorax paradoxus]|nr:hypothetical protein [Variovorax paradoxus]MBT2300235.1 hypothetical protein [Variovorax paradoxus]